MSLIEAIARDNMRSAIVSSIKMQILLYEMYNATPKRVVIGRLVYDFILGFDKRMNSDAGKRSVSGFVVEDDDLNNVFGRQILIGFFSAGIVIDGEETDKLFAQSGHEKRNYDNP